MCKKEVSMEELKEAVQTLNSFLTRELWEENPDLYSQTARTLEELVNYIAYHERKKYFIMRKELLGY